MIDIAGWISGFIKGLLEMPLFNKFLLICFIACCWLVWFGYKHNKEQNNKIMRLK